MFRMGGGGGVGWGVEKTSSLSMANRLQKTTETL